MAWTRESELEGSIVQTWHPRLRFGPRALTLAAGFAALVVLAVATFVRLGAPPRTVTLATGPAGSTYAAIGERYRARLARYGVTLKLLSTAGDAENLAKLADPRSGVSAAFVISGIPGAREISGLASLGTIGYEPLWLFERVTSRRVAAEGLAGKRISLGLMGSGTQALTERLFQVTGLSAQGAEVLHLAPADAAERLLRGELDVMAEVADWDSPDVRRLVSDPRVSIFSYRRADALVALNLTLFKLTLPAGTGDFAGGRPPEDISLVAPKASLLVREDLHGAVQYVLVDAASEIHAQAGIFHKAGNFPAAEVIDFPLSDEAIRYYKSGRPFLQRHLPLRAAVLLQRLLYVLVPLIGVLYPVARGLGSIYRRLMQQRILAFYRELRLVEQEFEASSPEADRADWLRRLDDLEHRASRVHAPVQYAQVLYTLKVHLRLARGRLAG